jgi:hypothetical protein
VFLDESGASTQMTRNYGRAPSGERVPEGTPQSHWHTVTMLAALTVQLRLHQFQSWIDQNPDIFQSRMFLASFIVRRCRHRGSSHASHSGSRTMTCHGVGKFRCCKTLRIPPEMCEKGRSLAIFAMRTGPEKSEHRTGCYQFADFLHRPHW